MASSLAELLRDYFNLGQLESEIIASAIIIALVIIVGWVVYSIFRRYLSRWAKKTKIIASVNIIAEAMISLSS